MQPLARLAYTRPQLRQPVFLRRLRHDRTILLLGWTLLLPLGDRFIARGAFDATPRLASVKPRVLRAPQQDCP